MKYEDYLQHLAYDDSLNEWQLVTFGQDDNYCKHVSDIHRTPVFDDLAIDHIDGVWLQNCPPAKLPKLWLPLYREQKTQQMAFNIQEGRDEVAAQRIALSALELEVANLEVALLEYLTLD